MFLRIVFFVEKYLTIVSFCELLLLIQNKIYNTK